MGFHSPRAVGLCTLLLLILTTVSSGGCATRPQGPPKELLSRQDVQRQKRVADAVYRSAGYQQVDRAGATLAATPWGKRSPESQGSWGVGEVAGDPKTITPELHRAQFKFLVASGRVPEALGLAEAYSKHYRMPPYLEKAYAREAKAARELYDEYRKVDGVRKDVPRYSNAVFPESAHKAMLARHARDRKMAPQTRLAALYADPNGGVARSLIAEMDAKRQALADAQASRRAAERAERQRREKKNREALETLGKAVAVGVGVALAADELIETEQERKEKQLALLRKKPVSATDFDSWSRQQINAKSVSQLRSWNQWWGDYISKYPDKDDVGKTIVWSGPSRLMRRVYALRLDELNEEVDALADVPVVPATLDQYFQWRHRQELVVERDRLARSLAEQRPDVATSYMISVRNLINGDAQGKLFDEAVGLDRHRLYAYPLSSGQRRTARKMLGQVIGRERQRDGVRWLIDADVGKDDPLPKPFTWGMTKAEVAQTAADLKLTAVKDGENKDSAAFDGMTLLARPVRVSFSFAKDGSLQAVMVREQTRGWNGRMAYHDAVRDVLTGQIDKPNLRRREFRPGRTAGLATWRVGNYDLAVGSTPDQTTIFYAAPAARKTYDEIISPLKDAGYRTIED